MSEATLTVTLRTRVSEDDAERLDALAQQQDRSVASIVRRAIRELLAKEAQRR